MFYISTTLYFKIFNKSSKFTNCFFFFFEVLVVWFQKWQLFSFLSLLTFQWKPHYIKISVVLCTVCKEWAKKSKVVPITHSFPHGEVMNIMQIYQTMIMEGREKKNKKHRWRVNLKTNGHCRINVSGNRWGALNLSLRRWVAQHLIKTLDVACLRISDLSWHPKKRQKKGHMVCVFFPPSLLIVVCEQAVVVIHRSGEQCACDF